MKKMEFKNKWHAALVMVMGAGAAVFVGMFLSGQIDFSSPTQAPSEQAVIIPAPAVQQVEPVKIQYSKEEGAVKVVGVDKDILDLSRNYRKAALQSKIDELTKPKPDASQSLAGGPGEFAAPAMSGPVAPGGVPANPVGGVASSSSDDSSPGIKVRMTVGGAVPMAVLEKDGERLQVSVGDKAWGRGVASISNDQVCLSGKNSRCIPISL